jgi:alpha-ribazole phosphatase
MSLTLDLLRHGETTQGGGFRGSLDDALTEHGWAQMRRAIAAAGPWDALVSSPLQRCAAFALELAEQRQLPLLLEPDLRELHFGAWEGLSAAEIMQLDAEALGRFWADPYAHCAPAGEAMADFESRVLTAVERLHRRYTGQRLLLVTHGGVMRLLLARARGLGRGQLLQVEVAHGALQRLQVNGPDLREGE